MLTGTPLLAETASNLSGFFLLLVGLIALVAVILFVTVMRYVGLWFQAFVSGAPISLFNIIGMSMRKIPPRVIVNARITSFKAGLKLITVADLETHYLAGGNIINTVRALIAADKANFPLTWRQATAIDLAGRDLLEAVKTSVNPKVIDCPDRQQGDYITAVAKDGVQLKCRARVTVRTNLLQLVGGATEDTIIARVGEGIVNAVGAAETHTDVLESPERISKSVLNRGLDAQTAFEILSIDIADIMVGENIGARLRADRAESDKRIAQAKAEERRAMAVAMEHENEAKVREMRAKFVEAEAQIPIAIADSFRKGNLGIMDYYRMKNIQSDTEMRKSLSKKRARPMKLENLIDFIIPIAILVLYLFLTSRKKKEEQQKPPAPIPKKLVTSAPRPKQTTHPPSFLSGGTELTSCHIDPAYAHKKKSGQSNAQRLLKKTRLRETFLLKEILNRPYD